MLRVEKKTGRKKGPWIWVLLALLMAAGGGLLYLSGRETPSEIRREDTRGSLVNREAGEVQWLSIQARGQEAWTAERDGDGDLRMQAEGSWILDETLGEAIQDALANLVYEDVLTEDASGLTDRLAEFGLEDPALTARVRYADGGELVFRIGDPVAGAEDDLRYMTVEGDPRLYAAAGSLLEDLGMERSVLRAVEQPEIQISRLDRITVRNAAGETTAEWALAGNITDADAAENWQVRVPAVYPADQDRMTSLRKNAGNLRLGIFVAEAAEESLREYGLDMPAWEIELHLAAGTTGQITGDGAYDVRDWEEETFLFRIGSARNELTDYCLYNHAVYTMNHFTSAALTETDPADTMAKYPVIVSADSLAGLEIIRKGGEPVRYELTYEAKPAGPSEGEKVQKEQEREDPDPENREETTETVATCRKNGAEISYEAFRAVYERWRVAEVNGRLPRDWETGEPEIRYVFRTRSGQTHTLELSDFDGLQDAVTLDGSAVFYLAKGALGEMP